MVIRVTELDNTASTSVWQLLAKHSSRCYQNGNNHCILLLLVGLRILSLSTSIWLYSELANTKSGTNRKLVYDFLLVVYSNLCRIAHRFWEIWGEKVQWPWNMPKVIHSCITWQQSCGHVCKIFGTQWRNKAKIVIFNDPSSNRMDTLRHSQSAISRWLIRLYLALGIPHLPRQGWP